MAELADAPGSGSGGRKAVRVQIPPSAPYDVMKPQKSIPVELSPYFSESEIKALLEREILQSFTYDDQIFVRLSQDYKRLPRGTVFFDGGLIPGYPHIMRILHLDRGINRYMKSSIFFVEEKMDGYNVRVSRIKERILAFTRGGFICPFTTDRINDLIDITFFDRYPDYTICGEVVGPGSPYNIEVIPYVKEDVVFFIFDIFKNDGTLLLPEERFEALKGLSVQQVNRWGPFDISNLKEVKEIILDLDRGEREGIVIKPLVSGKPLKYVTLSSCLRDMKATTHLISEIPAGFYIQRIMRALYFSYEFGIPLNDEYLIEAARSLYLKPYNTIKEVASGGEIKETFDIKVRRKQTATELLNHLNRSGIYTQLVSIKKEGDYYRLKFNRIYKKGTKETRQLLGGKGFFD